MDYFVGVLKIRGIRTLAIKLAIFYGMWLLAIVFLTASIQALSSKNVELGREISIEPIATKKSTIAKTSKKTDKSRQVSTVLASKKRASDNKVYGGIWDKIARCESSGNWQINTGNGYYGGVQFKLSSWKAVGGKGYPHQATKKEQIAKAKKLKNIQGWKAWPECSLKLGLR